MSDKKEFVDLSIAHQFGDFSGFELSQSLEAKGFASKACSKMTMMWDHAADGPDALNDWEPARGTRAKWWVKHQKHKNSDKIVFALKALIQAGADFDFLLDMQDRRERNLITPDGQVAPVFSFTRPLSKKTGHILWPLPSYHDVDGPEFLGQLDPNRVNWHDKKDMAVWRGIPGNRVTLKGKRNGMRMLPLLRKSKAGDLSPDETKAALASMPRYRFLKNWIDDPRFDVGYTDSDAFKVADEPFIHSYGRLKISRETFQEYKYIFVLPGNDVGSSFFWTMNSGSVGLVIDCDFETFATHHFKPWVHYVPVRGDQANVDRMMKWCANNQDECQAIAKRAQEKCKYLADRDLRNQINKGVVDKVREELAKNNKQKQHKTKDLRDV
tara:strand:+ start:595 stop:1743 length:1149 start_codon:yes stop_codon:yes gene_type:complete